jgi:membrane-associated phospholipid phosphatase
MRTLGYRQRSERAVTAAALALAIALLPAALRAQAGAPTPASTPAPVATPAPAATPAPTAAAEPHPTPTPSAESTDTASAPSPDAPARALGPRLGGDLRAAGRGLTRARTWRDIGLGLVAVAAVSTADQRIATNIESHVTDTRLKVAKALRPLGTEGGLVLLGGAWWAGHALEKPRLELIGQDGLEATLFAETVTSVLKYSAGRARPYQGEGPHSWHPFSGNASFPSGEATEAFAIAAVVSHHSEKVWVRSVVWAAASVVALDRIEVDAHWASDVVAGALIGGGVGHWLAVRHDPLLADQEQRRHAPELALVPSLDHRGSGVGLAWKW